MANKSFNPQGKFDWFRFKGIDFEIKAENDLMKGDVYIDDIVIKKKVKLGNDMNCLQSTAR